jgi:tripartite-type tricarboxylate transporter receptor subunit TctC
VTRLHTETAKALAMADTKTRLLDAGIIGTSSTPEQFNAYIQAETRKWAKVIKDAGIKAD